MNLNNSFLHAKIERASRILPELKNQEIIGELLVFFLFPKIFM